MIRATDIARQIKPIVLGWIADAGGGGDGGVYAPSPHDLSSGHHSGSLADSQAPQFLKTDGSRQLTGNLDVAGGVTVDSVDVSAFKSNFDTHVAATAKDGHSGIGVHTHQTNPEGGTLDHGAALTGLGDDDHSQYVHVSVARTITVQHTFGPASAQPPFVLSVNAQGQTVTGLRADQLNKSISAGTALSGGGVLTVSRTVNHGTGDFGDLHTNYAEHDIAETISALWTFGAGLRVAAGQDLQFGTDVELTRMAADVLGLGGGDAFRSGNYAPGISGWAIEASGDAEFNNLHVRGALHSTVFVKDLIEARAGSMLITKSGGMLAEDMVPDVEQHLSGSAQEDVGTNAEERLGQSWSLGTNTSWLAHKVHVWARKQGSPADNLRIALYSDDSGEPDAELCYFDLPAGWLTTSFQEFAVTLSPGDVAIEYGTTYWIVLSRTDVLDDTNYYQVTIDDAAGYSRGVLYVYDEGAWTARSPAADLKFMVTGKWLMMVEDPPGGGFLFEDGDVCRCKSEYASGIGDIWFTVSDRTDMGDGTQRYRCTMASGTRDVTYPEGAPVVDYGVSGDGGLLLTADLNHAPYLSVFTHAGSPWSTMTEHLRLGNLNGLADYTGDAYGAFIGDYAGDKWLAYDPANSLRVHGNALIDGTVTAEKLLVGIGGGNTLTNSAFLYDDDGDGVSDDWAEGGDATNKIVDRPTSPGLYVVGDTSQRIQLTAGNVSGQYWMLYQDVTIAKRGLREGDDFVLSGWIRTALASDAGASLWVAWKNGGGATIQSDYAANTVDTATVWSHYSTTNTVPTEAVTARIVILSICTADNGTIYSYFDAVQLERGNIVTAWKPGLIGHTTIDGTRVEVLDSGGGRVWMGKRGSDLGAFGEDAAGDLQVAWYASGTYKGEVMAGAGAVRLGKTGFSLLAATTKAAERSIKFTQGGATRADVWAVAGDTMGTGLYLDVAQRSGYGAEMHLLTHAESTQTALISLYSGATYLRVYDGPTAGEVVESNKPIHTLAGFLAGDSDRTPGAGDVFYTGELVKLVGSGLSTMYDVYAACPLYSGALASTNFDGDSYSDVSRTLLDLSSVFGAPAGIKMVLFSLAVRDSGAGTNDCYITIGPRDVAGTGFSFGCPPANDRWGRGCLIVPCNVNGDVYYEIQASGTATFEIYMQIHGYWI